MNYECGLGECYLGIWLLSLCAQLWKENEIATSVLSCLSWV